MNNIEFLYNKIKNKNKEIIFFGLQFCKYCKKTLEFVKKNNISYKYYAIDNYYDKFFKLFVKTEKIYKELEINPYHKTVPVIFINGKFIGGYNELKNIYFNKYET